MYALNLEHCMEPCQVQFLSECGCVSDLHVVSKLPVMYGHTRNTIAFIPSNSSAQPNIDEHNAGSNIQRHRGSLRDILKSMIVIYLTVEMCDDFAYSGN